MERAQLSAAQHSHPVFQELVLMAVREPPDRGCGYFEVTSHILCAKVNSVREHDKTLDLVEDVDAPHLLDAQRTRFE